MKKLALILFFLTILTACSQSEPGPSPNSPAPLLIYRAFFDEFARLANREIHYALMPDGSVYGINTRTEVHTLDKMHAEWERSGEKQIMIYRGDGLRLRYTHIGEARDETQVWQMTVVGEYVETGFFFTVLRAPGFVPENWKEFR
ncbi:hypothetical protein LGV61_13015 [Desulfurispirillum indicum]|uniref:hypothetical protein n=1 Tax=Desulfurispirillum indicum TaxID=936456 RepID=UPI001CFA5B85|nr:hypothetical protein [Desulfurispirillum indicum]UCZ56632.1 hypothetical protein LGV61_13015 [Desulfurispirillum indicum]